MNYIGTTINARIKALLIGSAVFGLALFGLGYGTTAAAQSIGSTETFFVQAAFDSLDRSELTARFIAESEQLKIYADVSYWDILNRFEKPEAERLVEALGTTFDTNIYPKLTTFYGNPWTPGIDGDPKLFILLSPMPETVGGYTNRDDEFERTEILDSNQKELIYLNTAHLNSSRLPSLLAHEFQHLITFNQKDRLQQKIDAVWLNELRSEYAPYVVGYDRTNDPNENIAVRVDQFNEDSTDKLIKWDGAPGDYASVSLFGHYLAERIGSQLLAETAVNGSSGIESINEALEALGRPERFEDLYVDWNVATVINDRSVGDGRYGYEHPVITVKRDTDKNLSRIAQFRGDVEINTSDIIEYGETSVYEFGLRENKILEIDITATAEDAPIRAVVIEHLESDDFTIKEAVFDEGEATVHVSPSGVERAQIVFVNTAERVRNVGFDVDARNIDGIIPVVDSVTPLEGKVDQQMTITITGEKFTDGTTVEISDADVLSTTFVSAKELQATIIPREADDVRVTVRSEDDISAVADDRILVEGLPNLPDGALIKALGDDTIYVISGSYKRAMSDAAILFYPHLNGVAPILVTERERDAYTTAILLRGTEFEEVYELDEQNNRHWLNMTAAQFAETGRLWETVFVINSAELQLYPEGERITF